MSRESIIPCSVCSSPCDGKVSRFCSTLCRVGSDTVASFCDGIAKQKQTEPRHIFFYDFAFGDLCDLYTTYLIRRLHTQDITKQRVVDRALERVERTITTKLNKCWPVGPVRQSIGKALEALYGANARIWKWKDEHWKKDLGGLDLSPPEVPFNGTQWNEFVDAYALRDSKRRELDRLIEGQTMTDKTYETR